MLETIQVNTPDHSVMVDITDLIVRKVQKVIVRDGVCGVRAAHHAGLPSRRR